MSAALQHEVLEAWAERVPDEPRALVRWIDYWPAHAGTICVPALGVHLGCPHALEPAPPDVVPAGPRPARQGRPRRRRALEALSTCPPALLGAHAGDCVDCGRAMGNRRAMLAEPELTRWFLYRSGPGICQGCRSTRDRALTQPTPRSYRRVRGERFSHGIRAAAKRGPVSPARLAYLRELIPCMGCGATLTEGEDGVVRMPHRKGCATARIRETRA